MSGVVHITTIQWNNSAIDVHHEYHPETTGGEIDEIIDSSVDIKKICHNADDETLNLFSLDDIEQIEAETKRVHELQLDIYEEAFGEPVYNETQREELQC